MRKEQQEIFGGIVSCAEGKEFDEFPPVYGKREYYRDNWGCLWYNVQRGLEGRVVEHPLADWKGLITFELPDPVLEAER